MDFCRTTVPPRLALVSGRPVRTRFLPHCIGFLLFSFRVSDPETFRGLRLWRWQNVSTRYKKMNDSDRFEDKSNRARLQGGATDLRKYTHQIWLAGLGAFAKAEEEGSKLFDNLVDAGREVESKAREKTETRVEEVKTRVKGRTGETLEKMEKAFDERLSGALSRLGIPNKREVEALNSRIEELTRTIERLSEGEDPKSGKGSGKR